ncbi:hypothetical protein [Marivirga harenae]|uniref:hypothetical protein n=1 Tax=Marivirga harenae TaxID=2010992 RepID=UPI0026DF3714|nr:hypothetical protein [Marivirga harenae]WKV12427.1 hypothetical protein Q3Y49_01080 [Marivirga harenae]
MNNKIYKIGFLVLLVINIAMLVLFVLKPDRSRSKEGIKEKIAMQLDFTEDQKSSFGEMVDKHRNAIRTLNDQERKLTDQYFSQLQSSSSATENLAKQEATFQEIMNVKSKKLSTTYLHLDDVKSLCNDEQLEKFDAFLKQVIPRLTGAPDRDSRMERRIR